MAASPIASSNEALRAVSRLLAAAVDSPGAREVARLLVAEGRTLFAAAGVALLEVPPGDEALVVLEAAGRPHRRDDVLQRTDPRLAGLATALDGRSSFVTCEGPEAAGIGAALRAEPVPGALLALALRSRERLEHLLVIWHPEGTRGFTSREVEAGCAFAAAAAAAMAQLRMAAEQERRSAQHQGLARAAQSLNASLDVGRVLSSIAEEARAFLGGDLAVVFRGDAARGLDVEAANPASPDLLRWQLPAGVGFASRVAAADQAMLTNDFKRVAALPPGGPLDDVQAAMAVPMHWDGELRGVLAVYFERQALLRFDDLALLEAFAELAAAASRNASAHATALQSARTDALTGCLNHAALMDGLRSELDRSSRTGNDLAVVLLDLDDFKGVNDRAGHLVGDELLRRVGHALRLASRPYDLVARHGGDEFALVVLGADEAAGLDVATRAIRRLDAALVDLPAGTRATAGVAAWRDGMDVDGLLAAADAALLHAKATGLRGQALGASGLPAAVRDLEVPATAAGRRPDLARPGAADRLHRRTRQLALAGTLGARLAGLSDARAICEVTADELHRAFGFHMCAVVALREDGTVSPAAVRGPAFQRLGLDRWSQPAGAGLIGRCLQDRAPVLVADVTREAAYEGTPGTTDTRSELVVPVVVDGDLWGVINLEETTVGAFDEDDAHLLMTVADQLGSALTSALLYEQLERAYQGTAEALAAALEAKDTSTAAHSRSIVPWAETVGRRLGMDDAALRDLRYGAIFHDIGKIAVPEAILHKPGPLDRHERAVMERHTLVGAQILAPVEFLAGVRPLVRHEHERWDGTGYPDRLTGDEIPLGARIILACDAYHAMTSDRPYRAAMDPEAARRELLVNAGSQFDPAVVTTLLDVLDAEPATLAV